jgi:antitoxin CptB
LSTLEANRLRWKCRRGLLELDLVLGRFLKETSLSAPDYSSLHCLLDLPDNDLWDIISGRSDSYDLRLKDVVARLRAA